METNELKHIWQTLANERLIDNKLAQQNISRIIALKNSSLLTKMRKKLKVDFISSLVASTLIFLIIVFAYFFMRAHSQQLPVQGYIFLLLAFGFYTIKSLVTWSKMNFMDLSFNTGSMLESFQKLKNSFQRNSKKESVFVYVSNAILTIFANVLINEHTSFSNFHFNSLQGIVLIFSIIYLISLPWIAKFIYNKRFSGALNDIDSSIHELLND